MLLVLGAIQYFVIAISAIALIPPLFLLPLWAVTIPAMMVERTDVGGAFNRSIELTRDRRWLVSESSCSLPFPPFSWSRSLPP